MVELPSRLRLAGQGAWRGKERGLAVIAGVFLASLVITTVLAYGVGLSQLFFGRITQIRAFDAKIEYARTPVENAEWLVQQHFDDVVEVCDELMDEFSQFNDCTLVLGRQAFTVQVCSTSSSSWRNPLKCGPSPTMRTRTGEQDL